MNLKKAIEIENQLFKKEIRNNYNNLSKIISNKFIEIDYQGNLQTKKNILKALVNEDLRGYTIERENYKLLESNEKKIVINYICYLKSPNGKKEREASRTSIWIKENKVWELLSHKAIPLK